jgi:glycyl-tRNA synthetase beta chain
VAERAEFLLEIGCEEIPASWLGDLTAEFRSRFEDAARKAFLDPAEVTGFSTPRRLVLRAQLATRQADREENVFGPALKAAKDAAGAWTQAALGFARKNGVSADELQTAPKDAGKPNELNLLFVKRVPGQGAPSILPGIVFSTLRGLSFPKRMSWDAWLDDGKGAFPFGRPIRWLLAVLGGEVVPMAIHELVDGAKGPVIVSSGAASRGHRFLPRDGVAPIEGVRSLLDLEARLEKACVLLDRSKRRERILGALPAAAHDHHLVAEWLDLVEYPTVLTGTVPAEFRSLPREVLETVLVHHQKYVPLLEAGNVAGFAAITNTDAAFGGPIVKGMERVVVARLRDGRFFWAEDVKRPLASRVDDLSGVTFHRDLGSYREKADRLVKLVDALPGLSDAVRDAAREAALLCKVDLTTSMVREFTELQGVMGGLYLREQGARPEVADAVYWQYHPASLEPGSAPAGQLAGGSLATFAAVALVDRIDTLAGYFGLGLVPTGSNDPFALRRAAQGAIRILLELWPGPRPSLRVLVAEALSGYAAGRLKRPVAEAARDLESFLLERLRFVLSGRGFAADEVEAVLGAREPDALDDPCEALARGEALHRVRSEAREDFEHLGIAFKRARNIVGSAAPTIDPARLTEPAERTLHETVLRLRGVSGSYDDRLRSLASLRGPVDTFFDDVLVMAEDPAVRQNRLGLLAGALALFYRIADISKLGGQS